MNIKEKIQNNGLTQWEVAEEIGVSEFTFSRWLRRPENINREKTEQIEKAIKRLKEENTGK